MYLETFVVYSCYEITPVTQRDSSMGKVWDKVGEITYLNLYTFN